MPTNTVLVAIILDYVESYKAGSEFYGAQNELSRFEYCLISSKLINGSDY